ASVVNAADCRVTSRLDSEMPSMNCSPLLAGSSQSRSRRLAALPLSQACASRPYQSGWLLSSALFWLTQAAMPPLSTPTRRLSGFHNPEPDEPGSVVPRSQAAIRRCVPDGVDSALS